MFGKKNSNQTEKAALRVACFIVSKRLINNCEIFLNKLPMDIPPKNVHVLLPVWWWWAELLSCQISACMEF